MSTTLSEELWPDVQPAAARRLMMAGLESFAERGYHATTTRDIATAAGMSPAALYVYFPSKLAMLFTISRSGHEQTLAMLEKIASKGAAPIPTMRRMTEEFVAWHARRHTVARVVQYELHALPDKEYRVVAVLRRQIEQLIRDTIAAGAASGDFHVADVKTAARAVTSLGVDVARWYTDSIRTSPKTLGKQYSALVLRMLGTDHDS
ncbi:MAG: TetR/AcrR family transcriptional regulator [Sciscionella sp.]